MSLVLGLSGFFATLDDELVSDLPPGLYHDAAACLIDDSGVLAAVEEERVSRAKHTNLFPLGAVRACLEQAGARMGDVERVAFFFGEHNSDHELGQLYLRNPDCGPVRSARELIASRLSGGFGAVPPRRVEFTRHHEAHAASTFCQSGLSEALVVVVDGEGDTESVSVFDGTPEGLRPLRTHPKEVSLGHFYRTATQLLGYGLFDEYKVMGLAPYGDPERFRPVLSGLLELRPEGRYRLDVVGLPAAVMEGGYRPRRRGEEFGQVHRDLAAAVQETLERIMLHLLGHWAARAPGRALCLAGGVAQNSSMNGRILRSGLFDSLFVHPASHDAGAALGAAVLARQGSAPSPSLRLEHVYWGPCLTGVDGELELWRDFLDWQECDDASALAAKLLAEGAVIGWARGRSEFGPRALGNRSILADPRPADNWRRVNRLVKQREGYRPLAPAVLEEAAHEWFAIPPTRCTLDYMGCVVDVLPSKRALLGAVTHVDGTARIQVVRRGVNDAYWRLIREFGDLTGVPVVLNTSFNNHAEPIVQTARDAVVCFLTTGLDHLVIGDALVSRKPVEWTAYLRLAPAVAPFAELAAVGRRPRHVIHPRQRRDAVIALSADLYEVLRAADGRTPLCALAADERLVGELRALWDTRLIQLAPAP